MKYQLLCLGGVILAAGQLARAGTLYNINSGTVYAQYTIATEVTGGNADASSGTATESLVSAFNSAVSASTSVAATSTSIPLTKSDSRDGMGSDYSQSQWGIFFTPTQNLEYSIQGTYDSENGNSASTYNVLLTQGGSPLYSGQITNSTIQNLSLTSNVPFTGALTGLLQAGVQYEYSGTSNITSPGESSDDTATGSDSITFTPVPEPASLSLLAIGVMGLLARDRRAKLAK